MVGTSLAVVIVVPISTAVVPSGALLAIGLLLVVATRSIDPAPY